MVIKGDVGEVKEGKMGASPAVQEKFKKRGYEHRCSARKKR